MSYLNSYRRWRQLRLSGITIAVLAMAALSTVYSQQETPDYRGSTYVIIRIDDNGIILVDSTGAETVVPLSAVRDDGSIEVREGIAVDVEVDPNDYPEKRARIHAIGRSVVVEENEHVYGGVTALGGDITIRGLVEGDVTSTGRIRLESTAVVLGNVVAQDVIRSPEARVLGQISRQPFIGTPDAPWATSDNDPTAAFVVGLIYMVVLLLFTFVVAMVFQNATNRVRELYSRNILKTLLFGFIAWLLLLPVFILLLITIIGIPVAILGMPLAMLAAAFLGGAAFSLFVSDFLKSGSNGKRESRATKVFMGFIVVQIPTVGFFLGLMVNSEALAIVSGITAGLLNLLVITLGFGGAMLTRFGTRDHKEGKVTFKVEVVDGDAEASAGRA